MFKNEPFAYVAHFSFSRQAISELPRPNRDTLAYLVVHLQAVASNSAVNKMDVDNLSMVMGPTIVGFSSSDPMAVMSESPKLKGVMRALLAISADYWSVNFDLLHFRLVWLKSNERKHVPVQYRSRYVPILWLTLH